MSRFLIYRVSLQWSSPFDSSSHVAMSDTKLTSSFAAILGDFNLKNLFTKKSKIKSSQDHNKNVSRSKQRQSQFFSKPAALRHQHIQK